MILPLDEPYFPGAPKTQLSMSEVPTRLRPPSPHALDAWGTEVLTALAYPNPVADGGGVTFTIRGPEGRWVQVMSVRVNGLSGWLVYRGGAEGGSLLWDTMGATGVPVASGVYLYTVRAELNGEWVSAAVEKLLILR